MAAAKVTYDDYAAMPDDGRRYEIIDGELCQIPTPPVRHQSVLLNLVLIIENHSRETRTGRMVLGPFDVVFSATNVVQPDMIFVSTARADVLTDDNAQGAPDIVVEVVSPWSRNRDEVIKRRLYADFNVAEYWMVDWQNETATIFRDGTELHLSKGDQLTTPLLPGLAIPLAAIFED